MKKRKLPFNQRIISLFLVFAMFVATLPASVFAAGETNEASTKNATNDIVLVLDVSGSMSGSPLEALKESATKFCSQVLDANNENRIAIISFANSYSITGFTSDLSTLENKINNLNASGGTNMTDAAVKAGDMLSSSTADVKSIIMMADGEPNNKTSCINAVSAYDSSYKVYSVGFFHSLSGSSLTSARTFMQSIQNSGYYESTELDNLIDVFDDVFEAIILPPFEITLSCEEIWVVIINGDENDEIPYECYSIKATITNKGNDTAKNAKAKIELPNELSLTDESRLEYELGDISANSSVEQVWHIKAEKKATKQEYQYSVVAAADNVIAIQQYGAVTTSSLNEDLTFTKSDMYSFKNDTNDLGDYSIDSQYLNYLYSHSSEKTIKKYKNEMNGEWNGSCFGMAVTAALFKTGNLHAPYWNNNAKNISDLTSDDAKSLINYYHLLQYSPTYENIMLGKIEKLFSNDAQVKAIKDKVSDNKPIIITLNSKYQYDTIDDNGKKQTRTEPWDHAIVLWGNIINCDVTIDGKNYNRKIHYYDINILGNDNVFVSDVPDSDKHDTYFYYNDDTNDFWLSVIGIYSHYNIYFKDFYITSVCNDLDVLDFVNPEKSTYSSVEEKNANAILKANDIYISYKDGIKVNTWRSYYNLNATSDFYSTKDDSIVKCNYVLPDINKSYVVKTEEDSTEPLDLYISYADTFTEVSAGNGSTVELNPNGDTSLTTDGSPFEISVTCNDGISALKESTITVSGKNATSVVISNSSEGFTVETDASDPISVSIYDVRNEKKRFDFEISPDTEISTFSDTEDGSVQQTSKKDLSAITFDKTSLTLKRGEKATLAVTVSPSDLTVSGSDITWTSSDESVATVSATGEVKGIKTGKATITATAENGVSATCEVTVRVVSKYYTVNVSSNYGGIVTPKRTHIVKAGNSDTIKISPYYGYKINSVTVNDKAVQVINNTVTLKNVDENCSVYVKFVRADKFNVTVTANNGGYVSHIGTSEIIANGFMKITVIPKIGYRIKSINKDGVSIRPSCCVFLTKINEDHTVDVEFEKITNITLQDIENAFHGLK